MPLTWNIDDTVEYIADGVLFATGNWVTFKRHVCECVEGEIERV